MKRKTTREEVLDTINDLYNNIIDLLIEMGEDEMVFTPKGCKRSRITIEGELFLLVDEEWRIQHSNRYERMLFEEDREIEVLGRVSMGYAKALVYLRKEQSDIKMKLRKIKSMGCLSGIHSRRIILEKVT